MKLIVCVILVIATLTSFAQTDSTSNHITTSGYIETYYCYDFANPLDHNRPAYVYSHNRHNEINLNLAILKATYESQKIRANLALMTGTYANANLAAEPGVLKNIYEANTGIKLSKNKNLWIDAGIFPSHIGFESAIGKDCWNVTRSILAENSPYYESGVKLTFTDNNAKWKISGLVLNGWQRIQRVNGNNMPAFGHQLTFSPNSKITLNSSSFIGSDTPDSLTQMRYFHNFYGQFLFTKKLGIIIGFDIGAQQASKSNKKYNNWYAPIIILKFAPTEHLSIAARGEYYSDPNGVIISTGTPNGFKTFSFSLNFDYQIRDNVLWRFEGRSFNSTDMIFTSNGNPCSQNYFLTTALAISF